jgi:hypothetical protein
MISLLSIPAPNPATLSATIDGLSVAPGQTVWLRFADINDPNNDHGLAIDDLSASVAGSVPGGGGGPEEPEPGCAALDTPIGAVQGSGASAAIVGEVTVQGVVVGDFEGPSPALRGFYLQDSGDGDPSSSDAIFVFNGNNDDVELGDELQLTGVAGEFQGQTQLSGPLSVVVCESGQTVAPTQVVLPVPSVDFLERYDPGLVDLALDAPTSTYPFRGFFGKLGRTSTTVKAGSALPVVFSLAGDRGLPVLTEGSPSYRRVD